MSNLPAPSSAAPPLAPPAFRVGSEVVVASSVVLVLLVMVVPVFADMFRDFGQDLPAPTMMLIAVSDFMKANLLWVILGMIAFWYLMKTLIATPKGRRGKDVVLGKLPIIGNLRRKVERLAELGGQLVLLVGLQGRWVGATVLACLVLLSAVFLGFFSGLLVHYSELPPFHAPAVIAALLTPPDVGSQLLMIVPLNVLYFLSVGLAYLFGPKKPKSASS